MLLSAGLPLPSKVRHVTSCNSHALLAGNALEQVAMSESENQIITDYIRKEPNAASGLWQTSALATTGKPLSSCLRQGSRHPPPLGCAAILMAQIPLKLPAACCPSVSGVWPRLPDQGWPEDGQVPGQRPGPTGGVLLGAGEGEGEEERGMRCAKEKGEGRRGEA